MASLPPDDREIIKDWAKKLPLRHQGVLIVATRGCDGAAKENSAKPITRAIRYAFMNCADEREVGMPSSFMQHLFSEEELVLFLKDWDHYPMHFIQHLIHACEVIGYKHDEWPARKCFRRAYFRMVKKLHLNFETEDQMDARLTEDRIASYGSANAPE